MAAVTRETTARVGRGDYRPADKLMSPTNYCIAPIFRVEEIFAIFANLDFARNFPPAKI